MKKRILATRILKQDSAQLNSIVADRAKIFNRPLSRAISTNSQQNNTSKAKFNDMSYQQTKPVGAGLVERTIEITKNIATN